MSSISQPSLRAIVYYEFLQGHNARTATANICAAFKKDVVHHSTVCRWYQRFESGNISFEDQPRSGRPSAVSDEVLRNALKTAPNATTRELAAALGCNHMTVANHLHELGYRKILSRWVPHELRDSEKASRISICESLLLRPHRKEFLRDIVTGDESWVLYVNHTRKRQWLRSGEPPPKQPKVASYEKKVLLCCWWDIQGMLYFEFRDTGTPITAEVYAAQLQKLANVIHQNRPNREKVFLLHDNARPHVAKKTREKILQLGWEVLPHPAYSPDLSPSDYYLFRDLKKYLRDKKFDDQAQLEKEVTDFFNSQSSEYWARGIETLPQRWGKVIDNDGEYITD